MTQWLKAYQTDTAGRYNGEVAAWESPLTPGVFLLPAGATFAPPPVEVPQGKRPRFNGTAWDFVTTTTDPVFPPNPADTPSPGEVALELQEY